MTSTLLAETTLPLGLNFFEILLEMFNLAILVVGVRFLLYKPVKKYMEKRSEEYKKAEEESEQKRKEAEDLKLQYEKVLEESRQNAITCSKEATASAMIQAEEIVENAKTEAERILQKAEEELSHKELMQKEELSNSVSELALDMASKILQREIKTEDNDIVINNLIERWKN
ncbi:MAG: ATP synthase F0 subunit B [Clostridia bacterium]|nr:ATP synthase F0 subunit B [Clostridia bacterium]